MNLTELVRHVGIPTDVFVRLYNYKCITLEQSAEFRRGAAVKIDTTLIPRDDMEAYKYLKVLRDLSIMEHMECYFQCVLFGEGPKIFRPTAEQMFALELMNLNVEVQDYHTPFKMVCIELPEAYARTKVNVDGENPSIALLYHNARTGVMAHDLMFPNTALKAYWRGEPNEMMEDWLMMDYSSRRKGILETTPEEFTVEAQVRRATLNYCLLLDEVGIRDEGYVHGNAYSRLLKLCRKQTVHTAKNKREFQALGKIYSPAKVTKLVKVVKTEGDLPGEQPGWTVKPHCRRGHYRMQNYKEGKRLRIRIPPCFVNAHLMTGPMGGCYQS